MLKAPDIMELVFDEEELEQEQVKGKAIKLSKLQFKVRQD